jgi:hypothetical protein
MAATAACGTAHAQSLLTYPGGTSTMSPPSAAPAQIPPAALSPPPAAAPAPQAAPQAASPVAPQASMPQAAPAPASSCDTDMIKLQEKRNATMAKVNAAVKPNKKGQVDPMVACPNLRRLVSVETEMRTWMTKNQSWCGIPDQIMDQMKEGFGKTSEIADRACAAAAQVRKAQEQMRAGGGPGGPLQAPAPKLPSGPL